MSAITKELLSCHHDVKPYRDAFHGRNSPRYLLCCSFLFFMILTIISGLMLSSSSNTYDPAISDTFINEMSSLMNLNRSTILRDTKNVYPLDLEFSISANKITSNKQFPICFAAPKFLMPLLRSPSDLDDIKKTTHETISDIDDIKKAYYNSQDDIFKKDWLKAPSFFKDHKQENDIFSAQYDEDDPFLNMRVEDIWESLIGYALDPQCFIRIDSSSNAILKQLDAANVETSQQHEIMCSSKQNVFAVMKPSFIVINPDNGMIYQLNINSFTYLLTGASSAQCYAYQNTLHYDRIDKDIFDKLLSPQNEALDQYFDDMSQWMYAFLLIVVLIVIVIYFGWMAFILICMLLEAFISTFIVWIIILFLKYFLSVFKEFENISPTFKQIWRINLLICVPDFTFVRLMQATSVSFYWRIVVRVILTLLLIIDVYQNDTPTNRPLV